VHGKGVCPEAGECYRKKKDVGGQGSLWKTKRGDKSHFRRPGATFHGGNGTPGEGGSMSKSKKTMGHVLVLRGGEKESIKRHSTLASKT